MQQKSCLTAAVVLVLMIVISTAVSAERSLVVIGDSLSAGYGMTEQQSWVHLLKQRIAARYRVVNASISGDTSRGGSARLGILLKRLPVSVAIIELGANDGLRGIDLAQTRKHLSDIIVRLQQADAKVLLVGMQIPPNLGPAYTSDFKAMYPQLAAQHNVPLVPFLLDNVADRSELMQADGAHPTATAQPQLLDNVWPHLEPLL